MSKLGEILLQQGVCTEEQIREALRSQIMRGGRLGTNLVESGAIDEEVLACVLGMQLDVPWLAGDWIACEAEAVALVPADRADRWNLVPKALAGRRLTVLCADPKALGVLDEVAFYTGKQVEAVVVPELRLRALLAQRYGIQRPLRGGPERWPVEIALTALGAARERGAVAGVLLRHAASRFQRAILFDVVGEVARGCDVRTAGDRRALARALVLPLVEPGTVGTAVVHGLPVDGPLGDDPSDARLVEVIGGGPPARALAIPILAGCRVQQVLYVDSGPGRAHERSAVEELVEVAEAAGRRYDQLPGRC